VSFRHTCAQAFEARGYGGQPGIRPSDRVAHGEQDFSESAHADAANSGEMDVLGLEEHFIFELFQLLDT
jgi:hypothetical protein